MSQRRNQELVRKSFPVAIGAVDKAQGIVEAIVAVMGNIDAGDDVIHPGAFAKTITERAKQVKVLDHHNRTSVRDIVGIPLSMREIGRDELPDDLLDRYPQATGGLLTETQYLINTPEGRGVFDRIAAEAVSEYSIGFNIIQSDYGSVMIDGKKQAIRNIREVRLWEYSPVIWGMNEATTTVGVKNEDVPEDDADEQKELTADGTQQRLGDYVIGSVHRLLVNRFATFYQMGFLDAGQYRQMNDLANGVLEQLFDGIPEDIAMMPIGSPGDSDMLRWERDSQAQSKRQPTEHDEATRADAPVEAGPESDETTPTDDKEAMRNSIMRELVEIDLLEARPL